MNVIVIGKPCMNVTIPMGEFPKNGGKYLINDSLEVSGGGGAYIACMLAKWGVHVYFNGVVGSDANGDKIKSELESNGVDVSLLETDYTAKTAVDYQIIDGTSGIATHIYKGNNSTITKFKYPINPDIIIIDGTDTAASLAALNNYPKAKSILLANKVNEDYYGLSKRCSHVIASTNFVRALTKLELNFNRPKDLVAMFQKVKDLNKAEYILMLREHGTLYISNRQVKMIPGISVEHKDDSNSSAAFCGAFAYGFINGYDMDTIAKTANIAGGLSFNKVGSIVSIPTKEEVFDLAGIDESTLKQSVSTPVENVVQQVPQTQSVNVVPQQTQEVATTQQVQGNVQSVSTPVVNPTPVQPLNVQTQNQNINVEMPQMANNGVTTNGNVQ